MLKQCEKCFTMKHIQSNKKICIRCENESD